LGLSSVVLLWAALHVEARLRGDRLTVVAYFVDDRPAADVAVAVRTERGDEVASGQTDDRGEWSFPAPVAGKYTITAGDREAVPMTIPSAAVLRTFSPAPEEIVVTGGPDRVERTRWPWLRPALAAITIAGLILVLLFARRSKRSPPPTLGRG
jgi:hypothetical protein